MNVGATSPLGLPNVPVGVSYYGTVHALVYECTHVRQVRDNLVQPRWIRCTASRHSRRRKPGLAGSVISVAYSAGIGWDAQLRTLVTDNMEVAVALASLAERLNVADIATASATFISTVPECVSSCSDIKEK